MPRFRVTMRDGRTVEVDAADAAHARSQAARQVGTAYPGVSAQRIPAQPTKERLYRVTFSDGSKKTLVATSADHAKQIARGMRPFNIKGVKQA